MHTYKAASHICTCIDKTDLTCAAKRNQASVEAATHRLPDQLNSELTFVADILTSANRARGALFRKEIPEPDLLRADHPRKEGSKAIAWRMINTHARIICHAQMILTFVVVRTSPRQRSTEKSIEGEIRGEITPFDTQPHSITYSLQIYLSLASSPSSQFLFPSFSSVPSASRHFHTPLSKVLAKLPTEGTNQRSHLHHTTLQGLIQRYALQRSDYTPLYTFTLACRV